MSGLPGSAPPIRDVGDAEVAANLGLVHTQLRRMGFREQVDPVEYEDLYQVGCLALWQALRRWQPARGARSTYCCHYIWGTVLLYRRRATRAEGYSHSERRRIASVGSYETQVDWLLPSTDDVVDEAHWHHLLHRLRDDIARLPEPLKMVARRCVVNGERQSDIAHELGVSTQSVSRYAKKVRTILLAPRQEAA